MKIFASMVPLALILLVLVVFVLTPAPTLAQGPTNTPTPTGSAQTSRAANIREILNIVQARGSTNQDFQTATLGVALNIGGQARTGNNSQARLDFTEGTVVRLGQNTLLTVEELTASGGSPLTRFQIELGKLWIALTGGTMDVKTPAGLISVRGSYATIEVLLNGHMLFCVLEGLGVYHNVILRNMQCIDINPNGQTTPYDASLSVLRDFCDNNRAQCPDKILGIKLRDVPDNEIKPDPSDQPPPELPPHICIPCTD